MCEFKDAVLIVLASKQDICVIIVS